MELSLWLRRFRLEWGMKLDPLDQQASALSYQGKRDMIQSHVCTPSDFARLWDRLMIELD